MKKSSGIIKQTVSPAETAERMRRMEGKGTGEIGSYKFDASLQNDRGEIVDGLNRISTAIENYGSELQNNFNSIIPRNQRNDLPNEMLNITDSLPMMQTPLLDLRGKVDAYMCECIRRRTLEPDMLIEPD